MRSASPRKSLAVSLPFAPGCDPCVLLDSIEHALAVSEASSQLGQAIPALTELDCDGHRSGVAPGDSVLVEIGRILNEGPAELRGVLTHAGDSYEVTGRDAHVRLAEQERLAAVVSANVLREAALPCPVVSIGSTPTAHAIQNLEGVTEVRAGAFSFLIFFRLASGSAQQMKSRFQS